MTRRLETRLKAELPIRLVSLQGKSQMEGLVYDISATYFRAKFPTEPSPNRKYSFQIVLPNYQQICGQAAIDRFCCSPQSGDYTFVIEDLSAEGEQILMECSELPPTKSAVIHCILSTKWLPPHQLNGRRLDPRFKTSLPVAISFKDFITEKLYKCTGKVINISKSGLTFHLIQPIPSMVIADFDIAISDESIRPGLSNLQSLRIRGLMIWENLEARIAGVRLLPLNPDSMDEIERFFDSYKIKNNVLDGRRLKQRRISNSIISKSYPKHRSTDRRQTDNTGTLAYGLNFSDLNEKEIGTLREKLIQTQLENVTSNVVSENVRKLISDFFLVDIKKYLTELSKLSQSVSDEQNLFSFVKKISDDVIFKGNELTQSIKTTTLVKKIKDSFRKIVGTWVYKSFIMERGFKKPSPSLPTRADFLHYFSSAKINPIL